MKKTTSRKIRKVSKVVVKTAYKGIKTTLCKGVDVVNMQKKKTQKC